MVSNELAPQRTALFNGASPADVTVAATEAANQLADVIKQRRLYQHIGKRDHVLIEGWQTLGTLVGVFAVKDGGVRELPWPRVPAPPRIRRGSSIAGSSSSATSGGPTASRPPTAPSRTGARSAGARAGASAARRPGRTARTMP